MSKSPPPQRLFVHFIKRKNRIASECSCWYSALPSSMLHALEKSLLQVLPPAFLSLLRCRLSLWRRLEVLLFCLAVVCSSCVDFLARPPRCPLDVIVAYPVV